jgi:osmoprotectant transport system substrate-binding protein
LPSRDLIAAALDTGEIGVGMLETTDPHLAGSKVVALADDRRLQPAENVVPLVRAR